MPRYPTNAFDLGPAEQKLNGPQIAGVPVDLD
jgi:hypothetical protein